MSSEPREPGGSADGDWLFLVYQLPSGVSNGRVKTWRRLQRLGAVWLRNAAYVLPNSAQAREDFVWIREEIASLGGAATIVVADAIDELDRRAIVEAFTAARAADYAALQKQIDASARQVARRSSTRPPRHAERRVRSLAMRLREIERIDFFSAPAGDDARRALRALEEAMPGSHRRLGRAAGVLEPEQYRDRTWVTRRRPGVDRMASAWLIRRFIDPAARFVFADPRAPAPVDQVAFDMFDGAFTHEGGRCTFEVLAARFGIDDPAVRRIATIVHDLDLKDDRHRPSEAPTVGTLIEGIRRAHADDGEALNAGIQLFEGLYRAFEAETLAAPERGRTPAAGKPGGPPRRRTRASSKR